MLNELLTSILSTRRGHNSTGELNFLKSLHITFDGLGDKIVKHTLGEGSIGVSVGKGSKVMFSCHIDTVHHHQEGNSPQKIFYDEVLEHVFLDKSVPSSCLGADDGAGVYVMLRMITANVPGFYVFHRGEEKGGIGANATLREHSALLKQFEQCIAFDRPNTHEVITHQGGAECASETYARELCTRLNKLDTTFKYEPSDRGVFTDSKVYRHVIRECINIGVGYTNQHGPDEYLDVGHLEKLVDACIKMDWHTLPVTRVCPPVQPPAPKWTAQNSFWNARDRMYDDLSLSSPKKKKQDKKASVKPVSMPVEPVLDVYDELMDMTQAELLDYIGDSELVSVIMELRLRLGAVTARLAVAESLLGVHHG